MWYLNEKIHINCLVQCSTENSKFYIYNKFYKFIYTALFQRICNNKCAVFLIASADPSIQCLLLPCLCCVCCIPWPHCGTDSRTACSPLIKGGWFLLSWDVSDFLITGRDGVRNGSVQTSLSFLFPLLEGEMRNRQRLVTFFHKPRESQDHMKTIFIKLSTRSFTAIKKVASVQGTRFSSEALNLHA